MTAAQRCLKNTLVACLAFTAAMSLVKHAGFLKEIRCLPLVASSIFLRTPRRNQGSNTGYAIPNTENLMHTSFCMKDLMSPSGVFSLLRNTEKHAMYYLEYCSMQGKQDSPPVKTSWLWPQSFL